MSRSANSPISRRSSQSSAFLRRVAASTPRICKPNSTFSRAFKKGNSASDCQTRGVSRSCAGTAFITRPCIRTSPSDGCSSPANMRSVVVFPQPDGPIMATNSPSSMVKFIRSTAVKSPNFLTTESNSTNESAMIFLFCLVLCHQNHLSDND